MGKIDDDASREDEIKALARDHAELAIETLVEVMGDRDAKSAARVRAAEVVLLRGFGAPERKIEQNVNVTVVDERKAHLDALKRLGQRRQEIEDKRKNEVEDADFEVIEKAKGKKNGN